MNEGSAIAYYVDNLEINPENPTPENFVAETVGEPAEYTLPAQLAIDASEIFVYDPDQG